jgi:hypothetical protein
MTDHPRRGPADDPGDAQLRELLQNAVADVEPTHGLGAIRSRTKVHPMSTRHPWLLAAGAAVLATAATITVVNLAGSGNPVDTSDDVGPAAGPVAGKTPTTPATTSAATGSPTTQPAASGATLPVYYVGDTTHGPRLYREFHPALGTNHEAEAVHDAVAGSPDDPDYTSLWPQGTDVQTVQKSGDTIVVDLKGATLLHDRPAGMSQEQAQLSVQQVVYTAQAAFQDRAPVQLLLDGSNTDTVLGVPTSEPLAQGAPEDVLAQVWIIDPAQDAHVPSGFTVSGLAATFEANVQWKLEQGGKIVKQGFTTAKECCTMSPYSFTVDAPPGDYTLVVHDEDASGGEGPGPWQDTKDISIVP